MVNPVEPMAAAFFRIFSELPSPFLGLFHISLVLAFLLWLMKKLSS